MLLIFDCDGVLVDSEPLSCTVDADLLTQLGFPITVDAVRERFVGKSLRDMVAAIETDYGRALPADFGDRLTRETLARFKTELQPIPGVREAILALPHPRCVASSSMPERIALSLRVTGLADLFERVFSAVEVARGKPAPDLFLHAARRMGCLPAECVVIEDSPYGVEAARAAGMPVIGFTGGGHCGPDHGETLRKRGADAVIGSMSDLADAVTRIAGAPSP